MITYKKGNLFDNLNPNKKSVILHIVNDGGAMGSGFAKVAYEKYPAVREDYIEWYDEGAYRSKIDGEWCAFKLGQIQPVRIDDKLTIVNMIAQSKAGGHTFKLFNKEIHLPPVRYDSLRECLYRVATAIDKSGNLAKMDIVAPKFGAGLAGGDWSVIEKIINEVFGDDINLNVWEL